MKQSKKKKKTTHQKGQLEIEKRLSSPQCPFHINLGGKGYNLGPEKDKTNQKKANTHIHRKINKTPSC